MLIRYFLSSSSLFFFQPAYWLSFFLPVLYLKGFKKVAEQNKLNSIHSTSFFLSLGQHYKDRMITNWGGRELG